jgi:hypothetical protein
MNRKVINNNSSICKSNKAFCFHHQLLNKPPINPPINPPTTVPTAGTTDPIAAPKTDPAVEPIASFEFFTTASPILLPNETSFLSSLITSKTVPTTAPPTAKTAFDFNELFNVFLNI